MKFKKQLFQILPAFVKNEIRQKYYLQKFQQLSLQDEKDLQALPKLVNAGDTVIDIGANFGLYTKFLSQLTAPSGRVFAFEPVPETFAVLKNNIQKSKLNNVTLFKKAISDKNGEAVISVPQYTDGSDNYYEASIQNTGKGKGVKIETIPLDTLLNAGLQKLNFIKMDVEGHEPEALNGAREILNKFHPKLMIEINDGFQQGSTGKIVFDFLQNFDYTMKYFDGTEIRATDGSETGVNFIFL